MGLAAGFFKGWKRQGRLNAALGDVWCSCLAAEDGAALSLISALQCRSSAFGLGARGEGTEDHLVPGAGRRLAHQLAASTVADTWSGSYSYGAWTTTSNTCAPSAPNCGGTPVEPTPICSFVIYAGAATSAANCSAGNYNWTPGSPTGYWCHLHLHIDPGYSCSFVTSTACPAP